MTRENAIRILKSWTLSRDYASEFIALDMAIKALSKEPKTGHWVDYKDEHECSQCRETIYVNRDIWEEEPYDYCPNCGAKMESEEV